MSAFGGKADIPSALILWAQWVPSRSSNRTEDGPPPLSKCLTKAQCRFGLRSGSFSCHWDKPVVSSHPAGSEILSSSLWLRSVVGVSLRAHQTALNPPSLLSSSRLKGDFANEPVYPPLKTRFPL